MKTTLVVLGIIASLCCAGRANTQETGDDLYYRYQQQRQQAEIDRQGFEQRNMRFDNQMRDQQRLNDQMREIYRESDSYRPHGSSYRSPPSGDRR